MTYNALLGLFVLFTVVYLFINAVRLSRNSDNQMNNYLEEEEIIDLVNNLIQEDKKYDTNVNIDEVVNIDTHPDFRKKRA